MTLLIKRKRLSGIQSPATAETEKEKEKKANPLTSFLPPDTLTVPVTEETPLLDRQTRIDLEVKTGRPEYMVHHIERHLNS